MLIFLIFVTSALAMWMLLAWLRAMSIARSQSQQIKYNMGIRGRWDDAFEVNDDELLLDPAVELPERRSIVLFIGDIFDDSTQGKKLAATLRDADLKIKPSEALGIIVITGLLSYIVAELAFSQGTFISATIALIVAFVFPWLVLRSRRDRRLLNFVRQLPTAAELIANSLRAGLALQGAIDLMSREIGAPASEEFGIVVREMRLGGSVDDALEALEQRMPSNDLSVMITALKVQRITGGNLIKSMGELSRTLIERQRTNEEIRTMISQAKYVAYFMPVLSILALAMLNRSSPGFLDVLFRTVAGWVVLTIFLTLQIIGFLLIQRFARIRV